MAAGGGGEDVERSSRMPLQRLIGGAIDAAPLALTPMYVASAIVASDRKPDGKALLAEAVVQPQLHAPHLARCSTR